LLAPAIIPSRRGTVAGYIGTKVQEGRWLRS
jgi:hypothetical protein